ncbi:hypothetical protein AMJ80_10705 [bacterium SM23_31]|nr:MAG: hypothetical protein AMJ80_10705 [bacterium SM23_31]
MFEEFPKTFPIQDGKTARIRPLEKQDKKKLLDFFKRLPEKDRMFLKEDVTDPEIINRWFRQMDHTRVIPLIVEAENLIIADGTLHLDKYGWSRHIGEIRLVVDKNFRKQTVGLHLVRELYFLAMKSKLEKLIAEMMLSQKQAIKIFKGLGFKEEAILKNHVKDLAGHKHNLVIMTHSVRTHWDELENMIADYFDDFSGDFTGSE